MAAWYVSSVAHAAVAQYANTTVYSVGDIVRQLAAPAVGSERCFRCTTAGTSGGSEPSWTLTKGATTNAGTAVFTEVTGNSTYGWAAASARLLLMYNTFSAAGDDIYVASDHAETQSSAMSLSASTATSAGPVNVYCVNPAGSVPPVAADLTTGATVSTTGASNLTITGPAYIRGITFSAASGASAGSLRFNSPTSAILRLENCSLVLNTTSASQSITALGPSQTVILDNCPMTFGATGQGIEVVGGRFIWQNTPNALSGTIPTALFTAGTTNTCSVLVDGVDLSAAGAGKSLVGNLSTGSNYAFVNCKLHASVALAVASTTRGSVDAQIIVSDSGANTYRQERAVYEGTLTTETTYVLDGGASDGTTPISWKMVTTANSKRNFPLDSFPIAVWNETIGSSVTATVEIENGGLTLTDADVWLDLEYLGDASYPIASRATTAPATPLTAGANLPTSSETWNGGLGSAVKQYLEVTVTPEIAGYIRGTVCVARASTTLYVNPELRLS